MRAIYEAILSVPIAHKQAPGDNSNATYKFEHPDGTVVWRVDYWVQVGFSLFG